MKLGSIRAFLLAVTLLVLAAYPCRAPAATALADTLQAQIGVLAFHGTPLGDVVKSLEDATGQSLFVNWKVLEPLGVVRTLPVTVDVSHLTLGQALDRLTTEVGGAYVNLGYAVTDGEVCISTQIDLKTAMDTRVYDIRRGIHGTVTRAKDIAAIIARVRGIDPLSWTHDGSRYVSVRELGGQLIVTQTVEVQARILQELSDIIDHAP